MPLILGLQKGHDFYVGASMTRVVVSDIQDAQNFTLKIKDEEFFITDTCSQEILPDVRISCGNRGSAEIARLIIDAPREIRVFRGNVVHPPRKKHHADVQVFKRSDATGNNVDAACHPKGTAAYGTPVCKGNTL